MYKNRTFSLSFTFVGALTQSVEHRPEYHTFSDGAMNIKFKVPKGALFAHIKSLCWVPDITELYFIVENIKHQNSNIPIHLELGYLPYARQDRRFEHEPLSLQVWINMLNMLGLKSVEIYDMHNEDYIEKINNIHYHSQVDILSEKIIPFYLQQYKDTKEIMLIAPDKGAMKKLNEDVCEVLSKRHNIDIMFFHGEKVRKDGRIKSVDLSDELADYCVYLGQNTQVRDKTLAIVADDICDGGGTFIPYAEEINRLTNSYRFAHLYTTHGIYSKGTSDLLKVFKTLKTRTSYCI